jgi:trk system potassium uptake protein TrkH
LNYRHIFHLLGGLLIAVALAMLPAAALGTREGLTHAWLLAMVIPGLLGLFLWVVTPKHPELNAREALTVVGLAWLAIVAAGAIPFVTTRVAPSVAGALFESVSGFTTTGATIFPVIEDLPPSILLWRSLCHWIGGMGIIVLGVAILPLLGVGGAQLFFAEAPGITTDKIRPRIATTARLLWGVYVGLTGALMGAYLVLGMSFFDALNHSMSALATGGFSTRTASMGYYSAPIQWVTILFMFLAGVNFTLHYRALSGKPLALLRNAEFRWYLTSAILFSLVGFVVLGLSRGGWSTDLARDAVFSVVSIHSTTGFGTADFAVWPVLLQALLLGLMFVGGMGGSTGGAYTMSRARGGARAGRDPKGSPSEGSDRHARRRPPDPPGPRTQGPRLPGDVHGHTRDRHCDPGGPRKRPRDRAQRVAGSAVEHRPRTRRSRTGGQLRTDDQLGAHRPVWLDASGSARILHAARAARTEYLGPGTQDSATETDRGPQATARLARRG